ncbi:MAG: metal ABC transporter ATP-binding protein [SAR324 cluster bacterium]|nr:metal ABC transporter ATP-binding protein [SAR324 cluster bacterium]
MALLEINNLYFNYTTSTPALKQVNLNVEEGDFLAILGPNGGGKTTLLKLIAGLLNPSEGTIRILSGTPRQSSKIMGYMPQHTNTNPDFPIAVLDVVLMGKLNSNSVWSMLSKQDRKQAEESLKRVGMQEFLQARMNQLSGGQKQRVLLARALLTHPRLLLLDEPTANIDASGKSEFYKLLRELNRQMTIIMISHDLNAIPSIVKSVACVNKTLEFHPSPKLNEKMITMLYGCDEECPVELIAHGHPHRILSHHHTHDSHD